MRPFDRRSSQNLFRSMYWEATVDAQEFFSLCDAPGCVDAWLEKTDGVVSVLSIADAESAMKAAAGAVMEKEGDDMVAVLLVLLIAFIIKRVVYSIANGFGMRLEMVTDVVGVSSGDASVDATDGTTDDVVLGCTGDAAVDAMVTSGTTVDDVVLGCAGDATVDATDGTTDDVVLGCAGDASVDATDGTTDDVVLGCAGDAAVDAMVTDGTLDDVVLGCAGDAFVDAMVTSGTTDDVVLGCAGDASVDAMVTDGTTNDVVGISSGDAAVDAMVTNGRTDDVVVFAGDAAVDAVEPATAAPIEAVEKEWKIVEAVLLGDLKRDDGVIVADTGAVVAINVLEFASPKALGKGGFGEVYLMEHKRGNKLYALKLAHTEADPGQV